MLKIDLFLNSLFTRSREHYYFATYLFITLFSILLTGENGFYKFSLKELKLV